MPIIREYLYEPLADKTIIPNYPEVQKKIKLKMVFPQEKWKSPWQICGPQGSHRQKSPNKMFIFRIPAGKHILLSMMSITLHNQVIFGLLKCTIIIFYKIVN